MTLSVTWSVHLVDDLVGDPGARVLLALLLLVWGPLLTWRILSTGDWSEQHDGARADSGENRKRGAMLDHAGASVAGEVITLSRQ